MKRNIFIATLLLLAATATQAQVLVTQSKDIIKFGDDKLEKIVFTSENYGDDIIFVRQSGKTQTFDIDGLHSLGFADDYNNIETIKESGKTTIAYDNKAQMVHIVNAKEGNILLFGSEGKLIKSTKGTAISVSDLPKGLYIVSYNKELNAKIIKK